jgi:phosphoglucosamine mutase
MKRLFGTDGIRAVAGKAPLDPATVRTFGAALSRVISTDASHAARVVLGRDTRESGPWLRDAVAAGLTSEGATAVDAGVITTPGLAHALRSGDFDAGVMISASHNPFGDNGLKVFGPGAVKFSDDLERRIEAMMLDGTLVDPGKIDVSLTTDASLVRDYETFLCSLLPAKRFKGVRLVLDCANGAASEIAPRIFDHYGAEFSCIGIEPDGRNINLDCGSLHLDGLGAVVREKGFDLGLGFDGDADRCLAVDNSGRIIDGDHNQYITGRRLKLDGRLRSGGIAATIMSNFWLEELLGNEGIRLHRSQVGDKYVLERMVTEDLALGGEQSGHIIFREHATTGDGILTGLMLLDTLVGESRSLDQIRDTIVPCPQLLINVRVSEKPDLREHGIIGPAVDDVEGQLADRGRVVLRYSGTEPVVRVMVEGKDADAVDRHARHLAGLIEQQLGG